MKKELIIRSHGQRVYDLLAEYTDVEADATDLVMTNKPFNIETIREGSVTSIINLSQLNDIRKKSFFINCVSKKLPKGGLFIGWAETKEERKKRLLRKYPWGVAHLYFLFDFVFKRVFPKLPLTRQVYHFVTAGRNQVLSKAEVLGRLVFNGFEIITIREINNRMYFVAAKITESKFDPAKKPRYGMLFKMKRTGKGGKAITVYKVRTMHPFSEYLQQYVYDTYNLKKGGKFQNDFRVTEWGRVLRALWIDELPMIYNLIKGDLKLFGVRPLSSHYLSLYHDELQQARQQTKPGLVPPFYADLPETLPEIMESEMRYLQLYAANPLQTDLNYGWRAIRNIFIRGARSS
ncbi:MAG: sugar transferase [Salibacteraceae bacterium]